MNPCFSPQQCCCSQRSLSADTEITRTCGNLADQDRLNLGSCVQVEALRTNGDEGRYSETLARELNLIEPENELKPPSLWRGIDNYDFANPDFLMGKPGEKGWAQAHRMKVRGHVLVYARDEGYTIPRWLLNMESTITPEQAKQILHNYILAVAGRYRGKIAMWDVVNEAIDDRPNGRPFNLRNSFWFVRKTRRGLSWFYSPSSSRMKRTPRRNCTTKRLLGGKRRAKKLDDMLALQPTSLCEKGGATITGIGLQYHTVLGEHVAPGDAHYGLLQKIQDHKFAFMITELDLGIPVKPLPRSDPNHGLIPSDPGDLNLQADRYAAIFRMARSFKNCHGVQMWGITDRHSWIPNFDPRRGAALLLDAEYHPKPAYAAVKTVLEGR